MRLFKNQMSVNVQTLNFQGKINVNPSRRLNVRKNKPSNDLIIAKQVRRYIGTYTENKGYLDLYSEFAEVKPNQKNNNTIKNFSKLNEVCETMLIKIKK